MSEKSFPNSGALFANAKRTSPKAPDFTGEIEFDRDTATHLATAIASGQLPKLRLAAWKKEGRSGTFLSLRVELPREAQARPEGGFPPRRADQARPAPEPYDLSDEVPF